MPKIKGKFTHERIYDMHQSINDIYKRWSEGEMNSSIAMRSITYLCETFLQSPPKKTK